MRINFWGVRGSLPAPELHAWRYGGDTPCLEVRASNQLLILDAGTGIRDLGQHLMTKRPPTGLLAYLLLSHYHWEHEGVLQSINFHGAYLLSPRPFELQEPVELVLALHAVHNGHSGGADKRHPSKETSKETVEFRLRGCVVRRDPQAIKNGWVGVAVHFPPSPLIEAHQPSQEPASPPGDAGPASSPRTMAA